MFSFPNKYLNSVVAIGSSNLIGKDWHGSGFLYGIKFDDVEDQSKYVVYLVTNRHVLDDQSKIFIKFNPDSNENCEHEIDLILEENDIIENHKIWTSHPNKDIDIAVLALSFDDIKGKFPHISFLDNDITLNIDEMQENNVSIGNSVYVAGFPMSILEDQENAPIIRSGIIAQLHNLYQELTNEFIIDVFIFPNNSGSPVFLSYNANANGDENGVKHSNVNLVGIVHSYYTYRDVAVSPQTLQERVIFEENSGLGAVHPVDLIEETIKIHRDRGKSLFYSILANLVRIGEIEDLKASSKTELNRLNSKIVEDIQEYAPGPLINDLEDFLQKKETEDRFFKSYLTDLKAQLELSEIYLQNKSTKQFVSQKELEIFMNYINLMKKELDEN
jgi:S1-C subfamily serine protease